MEKFNTRSLYVQLWIALIIAVQQTDSMIELVVGIAWMIVNAISWRLYEKR